MGSKQSTGPPQGEWRWLGRSRDNILIYVVRKTYNLCLGGSRFSRSEQGVNMAKVSTRARKAATPARVSTHPGEVLAEEFLKPLGLSVNALAMALRVPATRMGAIVKGERSVTADTALRLGRFFGNSPEFWMGLQATHDLTKARLENGQMIERDVHPRAA